MRACASDGRNRSADRQLAAAELVRRARVIDPSALRVSVVIPAYNEGESIVPVLERIFEALMLPCEVLVVVDDPADSTRPVVLRLAEQEPRLHCLVNDYGRGPANAIRYGIDHATTPVAVVTMADGCDDVRQIDDLVRLVERGVAVAAASRYMAGGQQVGGPLLKGMMSGVAGRSLRLLARVGTRDATNSFKAYSPAFVRAVGIDSRDGFEIGIELTAKARRLRLPIAEIPTIWLDRQEGLSNFRVAAWLPKYLRWYWFAFGRRLGVDELRAARGEAAGQRQGEDAEGTGHRFRRIHRRLPRRGATRAAATPSWAWTTSPSTARSPSPTTSHPNYALVEGDAQDVGLLARLLADCDHFVAGAAMIGGISYFHTYAYDLLATNERIIASSCDAAIAAHRSGRLQKVTYVSSSMVFESTDSWPSYEGQEREVPPPQSSYGFQKLAWSTSPAPPTTSTGSPTRSSARSTASGIGESRALGDEEILSGNVTARHEPCGPRPGAEGAQGSGPAAHPGRRQPGPPLHLRRRPGPRDRRRPWSTPRR